MSETTLTVAEPRIVELAVKDHQLDLESARQIGAGFADHFARLASLKRSAMAVADDNPALARVLRLQIKAVRIAAETTRKTLKARSLAYGKAVDGANSILLVDLTPIEERLEAIERAEEIRKEEARRQLLADRQAAIELITPGASAAYGESLAAMEQPAFDQLAAGIKAARDAAIEAKRLADEAEAKRKAEEAAEKERLRQEAAKLKEELRQAQAQRDAELAAAKAEAARLKAESDAAARKAAEETRAAQAKRDAELAAAKAEADRVRVEADAIAKKAADAKAALRVGSDRSKMKAWLEELSKVEQCCPDFDSQDAITLACGVTDAISQARYYCWSAPE